MNISKNVFIYYVLFELACVVVFILYKTTGASA
jgi:hypothetical protein